VSGIVAARDIRFPEGLRGCGVGVGGAGGAGSGARVGQRAAATQVLARATSLA